MKTVVNSQQVAHLWANQSQDYACNAGRSMSFNGNILLSYSTPIGRLVKGVGGESVALMTPESYSMTTAGKHKPAMRGAVRHLTRFTVPSFGIGRAGRHSDNGPATMHADNLAALIAEYTDHVAKLKRKIDPPDAWYFEYQRKLADDARKYAETFGQSAPVLDVDGDKDAIDAVHIARNAKRADPKYAAKRERDRAARESRRIAKETRERELAAATYAEKLAAWRAGETVYFGYDYRPRGAMLRVKGDTVETSQGAEVPVADARRAVIFVTAIREKGEAWQRNGATFKVGAFQLDRVSAEGDVNAGCHFIEWDEVARLGAALGMTVQS